MKKKNTLKVILIVGVLVILGVILARWLMKNRNSTDSDSTVGGGSTDSGGTYQNTGFPLKRYSKGDKVKHLQSWLNATGNIRGISLNYDPTIADHDTLNVDGKFGYLTERSLKQATGMTSVTQAYYITKGMADF